MIRMVRLLAGRALSFWKNAIKNLQINMHRRRQKVLEGTVIAGVAALKLYANKCADQNRNRLAFGLLALAGGRADGADPIRPFTCLRYPSHCLMGSWVITALRVLVFAACSLGQG